MISENFYNVNISEVYFTHNFCVIANNKEGIDMDLNRAFALRLTKLLVDKNMTKYRLEKESGLTHSALRYVFNEINKDVKFSTIVKVCNALNMTISEFFDDNLFEINNLDFE